MARPYRMTAARRVALRKAQIASARKRKGKGKGARPEARNHAKKMRRRKNIKRAAYAAGAVTIVGTSLAYNGSERATVNRGVRKSVRKKGLTGSANKAARITHGKRVRPLVTHNVRRKKASRKAARKQ